MFKVEINNRIYSISADDLIKLSSRFQGVNVIDFSNLNQEVYNNEEKSH